MRMRRRMGFDDDLALDPEGAGLVDVGVGTCGAGIEDDDESS